MRENKNLKGSITVEMSYVLPLIIAVIVLLINTVFYYHDKAVIIGAAGEVAEAAAEDIRINGKRDMDAMAKERIGNKLIMLKVTDVKVDKKRGEAKVSIKASKGPFRTGVSIKAEVPYPEKALREKKKAEDLLN